MWNDFLDEARESYQDSGSRLVLIGSSEIHRGITGIIASRLVRFFNAPAFVVSLLDEKAVGSARSVDGVNVKDMLDELSDIFLDYGGHDYAAGYSMEREQYDYFRSRLFELASSVDHVADGDPELEIDAELPDRYMTPELVDLVERFEPYGESNPPLVFVARRATIEEMKVIGKKEPNHLRLLIKSGNHRWPAVFWNAADRVNRDFSLRDTVDVAFRLGRNYYQQQEQLQLTVLDIQR